MKTLRFTWRRFCSLLQATFCLNPTSMQPDWVKRHILEAELRKLRIVKFVGGPLDGWSELVELNPLAPYQQRLTLPISESLLRGRDGVISKQPAPITSIATYERQIDASSWTYHFVDSGNSQFAAAVERSLADTPRKVTK